MHSTRSCRQFLRTSTAAGIGLSALGHERARAAAPNDNLRVPSIGVVGSIGSMERTQVN